MNAPTTRKSLSSASLENCIPSALKKDAAKYFNQIWTVRSAVFFPAVALQKKISLPSKFSRNLGNMSRDVTKEGRGAQFPGLQATMGASNHCG